MRLATFGYLGIAAIILGVFSYFILFQAIITFLLEFIDMFMGRIDAEVFSGLGEWFLGWMNRVAFMWISLVSLVGVLYGGFITGFILLGRAKGDRHLEYAAMSLGGMICIGALVWGGGAAYLWGTFQGVGVLTATSFLMRFLLRDIAVFLGWLVVTGIACIVFGWALVSFRRDEYRRARAAGILTLISGVLLMSIIFWPIGLLLFLVSSAFHVQVLFDADRTVKVKSR